MSAASDAALAIPALLCCYADSIDAGRFADAAALFDEGELVIGERTLRGREAITAFWTKVIRLYEDGTPRSRHLVSNISISLDAQGLVAACSSQWTLLHQPVPGRAPQLLATGRYEDKLILRDGCWRFAQRRYAGIDMAGDLSAHLTRPPRGGAVDS